LHSCIPNGFKKNSHSIDVILPKSSVVSIKYVHICVCVCVCTVCPCY
jgi:hypothetical protein